VAASSLFSVTDADSDAIARYEFWDDVNGGGYWRVNGVQQAAAQAIAVSAADLANTDYVGGANGGTERVWVRANDGLEWSAWKSWNVTTALHVPNVAPVVSASDQTVLLGQTVDASSLFSVSDADNDPITQYEFWDSSAGNGHFTVNGAEQGVNVSIPVSAAQLAGTKFVGGSASGSDLVWARANDGQTWSDWKSWNVNSWPHLTNAAPVTADDGPALRPHWLTAFDPNTYALVQARAALGALRSNPVLRCQALRESTLDAMRHQPGEEALGFAAELIRETNHVFSDELLRLDVLRASRENEFKPALVALQLQRDNLHTAAAQAYDEYLAAAELSRLPTEAPDSRAGPGPAAGAGSLLQRGWGTMRM